MIMKVKRLHFKEVQRFVFGISVILLSSLIAVSCSKDKDDAVDNYSTPAEAVAGTYIGTVSGGSVTTQDATIVITANSDGTIRIKQPNFTSPEWGDDKIVLEGALVHNIPVSKGTSGYTFNLDEYSSVSGGAFGVTGYIKGSVTNKDVELSFTFNHANLLKDPLVKFTGKKQ